MFARYLSATDWWNFRLTSKTMVPEKWTWDVLWNGPAVCDTYAASRFVHSLSVHPVEYVLKSITRTKILRMAFVVLKSLGYNVRELACRCNVQNLIIWRLIF